MTRHVRRLLGRCGVDARIAANPTKWSRFSTSMVRGKNSMQDAIAKLNLSDTATTLTQTLMSSNRPSMIEFDGTEQNSNPRLLYR